MLGASTVICTGSDAATGMGNFRTSLILLRAAVAVFAGVAGAYVASTFLDNRHGYHSIPYRDRLPAAPLFANDELWIAAVCGLLCVVLLFIGIESLTRRGAQTDQEAAVLPVIAAGVVAVVIVLGPFLGEILWPGNPGPEDTSAQTYGFLLLTVYMAAVIDVIPAAVVGIIVAVLHDVGRGLSLRRVLGNVLWTSALIVIPLALVVLLRLAMFALGARLSTIQMFNLPAPGEALGLFALSALIFLGVVAGLGYVASHRWRRSDLVAGAVAAGAVGLAVLAIAAVAYFADLVSPYPYEERPPESAAFVGYYAMVGLGVPLVVAGISLLSAWCGIVVIRRSCDLT